MTFTTIFMCLFIIPLAALGLKVLLFGGNDNG